MDGHAMRSLAVGTALALSLLGFAASTAHAQEYAIYLYGHAEPVKASFYAEDPPWIFFRDDESQYVFTVGCNRVRRVERGGTAIPPVSCLVERLPTTMSQVYANIMDSEDKRLDDLMAKQREQTRAYTQAVTAGRAAVGEFTPGTTSPREMEQARRQAFDALERMREELRDLFSEVQRARDRVGALVDMSKSYPKAERQRFYFFSK
jgi:hypothetical protein